MTNEELDKARADEAWRIHWSDYSTTAMDAYRQLVRTGWTPAPKIDPLLLEAREICAAYYEQHDAPLNAEMYRDGKFKLGQDVGLDTALAALKRGMELAREQGKAEPICGDCKRLGDCGCETGAVQDDPACSGFSQWNKAEPVAPVPVDRAREVLDKVCLEWAVGDENEAAKLIRTYGDERERAGIERVIEWVAQHIGPVTSGFIRRDLLGGAGDE